MNYVHYLYVFRVFVCLIFVCFSCRAVDRHFGGVRRTPDPCVLARERSRPARVAGGGAQGACEPESLEARAPLAGAHGLVGAVWHYAHEDRRRHCARVRQVAALPGTHTSTRGAQLIPVLVHVPRIRARK